MNSGSICVHLRFIFLPANNPTMHNSDRFLIRGGFESRAIGLGFILAACTPLLPNPEK
jgi:hypothetical protein